MRTLGAMGILLIAIILYSSYQQHPESVFPERQHPILSLNQAYAASKNRVMGPSPLRKISPNLELTFEMEPIGSDHGRRITLTLTAKQPYQNMNFEVELLPNGDFLEGSVRESGLRLGTSESLVREYIVDLRDFTETTLLKVSAHEEQGDRRRQAVTELFEVFHGEVEPFQEKRQLPKEKQRRVFQ